jgi:16S rRNA (guanine527-N7)-methyltransferase
MTTPLPTLLPLWQSTTGWQPNAAQLQQFQNFYDLVAMANKSLNLTRILEPAEFWEKHLWDSLQPIITMPELTGAILDLGTGGGFPGVPIAIAKPDWSVTVADSTAKKINFIRSGLAAIPVSNLTGLVDRAETLGRDPAHREHYQLVTIRAVAEPAVCAEYALPLLAVGGTAVLYRGHWSAEETTKLEPIAQQLGATINQVTEFVTPLTQGLRHCIYLRKHAPTPLKFPRAVGTPTQKPLV